MAVYSRREGLRKPGADDPDLQEASTKFRYVVVAYVLTVVIGLVYPRRVCREYEERPPRGNSSMFLRAEFRP
jgi:hypothetical protein